MMLLPCPWCGPRNVQEFGYGGEAKPRPDGNATDPAAWRDYLYQRANPAGWVTETWYHRAGCRRYLTVQRHTLTNEVRSSRRPDAGAAQLGLADRADSSQAGSEPRPGPL